MTTTNNIYLQNEQNKIIIDYKGFMFCTRLDRGLWLRSFNHELKFQGKILRKSDLRLAGY